MSIYLDNGATSFPKPETVKKAVINSINNLCANPGRGAYPMAEKTAQAVYNVRKKAGAFFGASGAENVIFTKNCTEAINLVLFSCLKSGDHVVISDLEHNAVLRPLHELSLHGISYSVFKTYDDDEETLNSLRKNINDRTKLFVCTVASNVFGIRLPIIRLCAMCKLYDIETMVDAAQGAGIIDIDMTRDGIDYLCVPSHKGLYGIMGSGMLITNKYIEKPLIYGGTGYNSLSLDMGELLPEKLESGTLSVPAIISMGAGIDFIRAKGRDVIYNQEMNTIKYLYKKLNSNKKFILYTDFPNTNKFVPVLSFNVKGKNCEEVGDYLSKKGVCTRCGFHCAKLAHEKMGTSEGTVRISPSYKTNIGDMNTLYDLVKLL